jgi:hypothetical protein
MSLQKVQKTPPSGATTSTVLPHGAFLIGVTKIPTIVALNVGVGLRPLQPNLLNTKLIKCTVKCWLRMETEQSSLGGCKLWMETD